MDNLETQPAVAPELRNLQEQYDALRHLVVSILILFVVVTGTFDLFLLRLVKSSGGELTGLRSMVAEYNRSAAPQINEFARRLADFSRTHPDFAPVLAKYGIKTAGATSSVPINAIPPAAPAPKK